MAFDRILKEIGLKEEPPMPSLEPETQRWLQKISPAGQQKDSKGQLRNYYLVPQNDRDGDGIPESDPVKIVDFQYNVWIWEFQLNLLNGRLESGKKIFVDEIARMEEEFRSKRDAYISALTKAELAESKVTVLQGNYDLEIKRRFLFPGVSPEPSRKAEIEAAKKSVPPLPGNEDEFIYSGDAVDLTDTSSIPSGPKYPFWYPSSMKTTAVFGKKKHFSDLRDLVGKYKGEIRKLEDLYEPKIKKTKNRYKWENLLWEDYQKWLQTK